MDYEKVFDVWGLPSDFMTRHWRRAYAIGRVTQPRPRCILTLTEMEDLLS